MTFTPKDYDSLKKEFDTTVQIILDRDKKKEVALLEDPRRKDQITFIQSTINELENQLKKKEVTKVTKSDCASILNGAMLLVQQDIADTLKSIKFESLKNSLLHGRLNVCMGITSTQSPSITQSAEFFRRVNHFLTNIYIDRDSRKGINLDNPMKAIERHKLVVLVAKGCDKELEFQNLAIKQLTVKSKHEPDISIFSVHKKLPTELLKSFESWDKVQANFDDLIVKELADKNVPKITDLNPLRAAQLNFLSTLKETLQSKKAIKLTSDMKTAIFIGAEIAVRGQIAQEYGYAPTYELEIKGSVIHSKLTEFLKIKSISPEDLDLLTQATFQFLRHMTTDEQEKEMVYRKTHPFSAIKDFNLSSFLMLLNGIMHSCRISALTHCNNQIEKDKKEEAKLKKQETDKKEEPSPLLSYFFNSSKTPTVVPSIQQKIDEKQLETSGTAQPK